MPDHIQANQPDPAIRVYIKKLGGPEAFATKHNLSVRNAQRIYNGSRPCPNRLRDEITGMWIDELVERSHDQ